MGRLAFRCDSEVTAKRFNYTEKLALLLNNNTLWVVFSAWLCMRRLTRSLTDLSGWHHVTLLCTCAAHHSPSRPSLPSVVHTRQRQRSENNPPCTQTCTVTGGENVRLRVNKSRLRRHLIPSIAFLLLMVWGASTHCLSHTHTRTHICCFNPSWVHEHSKMVELCLEADACIQVHWSNIAPREMSISSNKNAAPDTRATA